MNIKVIREQLMLTQTELADLIGVSMQTVSNWELGLRKISFKNKRKILKLCMEKGIKLEK